MCAHTHAHIYLWLLASDSHCFQLAFTPTLPRVPPQGCWLSWSFPCSRHSVEQQEGPRQLGWARCDTASAPVAQGRVEDGQGQPLIPRMVVCPAQEGNWQVEVSPWCSWAEWNAQRACLGQVYMNPHRNKSHKLRSCLQFWLPDPQRKARRVS